MKISYAINNLRSLDEMEPVELRPITILVGANSSGKSTFLRSLSLLRQSLEEVTNEPILWYGRHADFGDYIKSVREKNLNNEISFEFSLNDIQLNMVNPLNVSADSELDFERKILNNVEYKVSLKYYDNSTYINKISLKICDHDLEFVRSIENNQHEINSVNHFLNGKKIENEMLGYYLSGTASIFSDFNYVHKDPPSLFPKEVILMAQKLNLFDVTTLNILNIFNLIHNRTEMLDVSQVAIESIRIAFSHPLNEKELVRLQENSRSLTVKMFYQAMLNGEYEMILEEIKLNCALALVFRTCEHVSSQLKAFFLSSTRLGPSRDLDRGYRYQGLDVSELAVDGRNFPMFLKRLKDKNELQEFSNWVKGFIGYEIEIIEEVEHFFINLRRDGLSVNVTDTGYGLSQILPVLALIWMNTIRKTKNDDRRNGASIQPTKKTIEMEQPELHLHPKLQAKIADALVSALNHNTSSAERPMFIVETHSEPLISRLGELIENRKVSEKDVQVVLFSKRDNKPNSTEVKTATFNDIGALSNWPYGFFNY